MPIFIIFMIFFLTAHPGYAKDIIMSGIYLLLTDDFFFFFCFILGLPLWHMEVPRLGVKLEIKLPAYTTATATWHPSCLRPTPQLMVTPDP